MPAAAAPSATPPTPAHVRVESELLAEALRPRSVVLDAGCGRTTRLGSHREAIAELVGFDLDEPAARENAALDRCVIGNLCEPLPFADSSFDVVYADFVVEHLTHPAPVFREWRRVLRADGSLVLLTSNIANRSCGWRAPCHTGRGCG